jgi:hypothetical protein
MQVTVNRPSKRSRKTTSFLDLGLTRILAVDHIGEGYNEMIHLLVDYAFDRDPFESGERSFLQPTGSCASRIQLVQDGSRIAFFPEEIPDERDAYQKKIRKKHDT